ncbi:hypothetical protein [uncultured Draconibacterium sp.]|uniref:hypothetical protein n=1 Tax=uncultured Draconibacterium sp. TaxID=1573823 RepID=UPI002600A9A3|nr:hypothetical protein [uncultured Draconibacterium sp.]
MRKNIFILLISLFLFGCNSNNSQQENVKNADKTKASPTLTEMVWKDYNEILFLLSQKHQIDSSIAKPLITEYLRIHDPMTYFSLTIDYPEKDTTVFDYIFKPRENIGVTIQRLSESYSIETSTLSCFIYDFKVFDKLLKIEEECENYPVDYEISKDY